MILSTCRAFRLFFVLLICSATLTPSIARASDNIAGDQQQSLGTSRFAIRLADYYLGMENYPAAIRRHLVVIREHPDNALAHYHLGFAYGVIGQHRQNSHEYRRAVELGLDDWQLFLNLGLVYLEDGQPRARPRCCGWRLCSDRIGPRRISTSRSLMNGAGARTSRAGTLLSLQIDPSQPDARNTLGAIYAEEGDIRQSKPGMERAGR